jgi:acyl-CoA thioester hydrolase
VSETGGGTDRDPVPADFGVLWPVHTRWADHDTYGHVNNATYYEYFDTAVNGWLIAASGTDIRSLDAIGVVAETSCRYVHEIWFPDELRVGISIERLGERSIVYSLAIFREPPAAEPRLAAIGRFVHVYVDARSRRPVPIPPPIRAAASALTPSRRSPLTTMTGR